MRSDICPECDEANFEHEDWCQYAVCRDCDKRPGLCDCDHIFDLWRDDALLD